MSFLALLGQGLKGYQEGKERQYQDKRQATLDAQQQAYDQAQIAQQQAAAQRDTARDAEQKRIDDQVLRNQYGVDPATGQPLPQPAYPKPLTQVLGHDNHGVAPTNAQLAAYHRARADAAMAAGDKYHAEWERQQADDYDKAATQEASAGLNVAKTETEGHRRLLIDAQTAAEKGLDARMRQIAAGHDQAMIQRQANQIANSQLLAQYNANSRAAIANYAAAIAAGRQANANDVKAAIDEYNKQMTNWTAAHKDDALYQTNTAGPEPTLTLPSAPAVPPAPQINYYLPGFAGPAGQPPPGGAAGQNGVAGAGAGVRPPPPPPPPINTNKGAPGPRADVAAKALGVAPGLVQPFMPPGGAAAPAQAPDQDVDPSRVSAGAAIARKQLQTDGPQATKAGLEAAVKAGKFTRAEASAIEQQLGLGQVSQATPPFPPVRVAS